MSPAFLFIRVFILCKTCLDLQLTGSSLATGQYPHLNQGHTDANNHEARTVLIVRTLDKDNQKINKIK